MRETAIDFLHGEKTCSVFSSDQSTITKLRQLAADYPDEVHIDFDYECTDSTSVERDNTTFQISVPAKWFRLPKPPKKMNFSEEEKKLKADRMREVAKMRHST